MFSFDVEASEIYIGDEIGPDKFGYIGRKAIKDALKEMDGKHVRVLLNTPGGNVDEGVAIYNALKSYPGGVTTVVDSLAASMGSYLLQAGEHRVVASNSMVMIHDPWTVTYGNAAQLRKDADILDKFAERMIPDYAARSGKTEAEVLAIMNEETWYTGKEAVEAGWADAVDGVSTKDKDIDAKAIFKWARNVPESLCERLAAPKREQAKTEAMRMTVADAKRKIAAMAK